jgi:hypothetical protein
MAVLSIFSPGWVTAASGTLFTQFVPNPFGTPNSPATDVWVQCTTSAFQVIDTPSLAGFAIIEFESLDSQGQVQRTTFGDVNNLANISPQDLPARLFVPQLLSVTLAVINASAGLAGTVTLFQWG